MYCHVCGFLNPENTKVCLQCGARLISNTNPRYGDLSEFDNDNIVAQLISKFEENFSAIFETIDALAKKSEHLESQLMELRSGLLTLVDLLSEKDLIKREKFSHIWENNIIINMEIEEERDRFISMKDEIILVEEKSKKDKLELLLNRVEDLYFKGENLKAIELLEKASQKHKNNYKLHLFLGQIYYLKKEYSRAIEHLFKSYALNPEDYQTNLYLGITLNEIGKQKQALEFLFKATELEKDDYLPFFTIGTIYYYNEELKLAKLFLTQALEIEEKPEILFFLALIYKQIGRNKKAEKLLKKAIEMEPDFEDAYYQLGIIYLELNWHKKAKSMFEKVLSLNPKRFELNAFKIGKSYNFSELKENARVTRIAKKCERLIEQGEKSEAIKCYKNILGKTGENPVILVKIASLLVEMGENEEAITLLKPLLDKNISDVVLIHAYNIVHSAKILQGKIEEAFETMKKFEKKAKNNYVKAFVKILLAFDLIELNKVEKAIEKGKEALKIAPRELRHLALDALGYANYRSKRYQKAKELLEESISIEGENNNALYHLGMTYLALKKKNEAKKVFEKLIKLKDKSTFLNPFINDDR